MTVAWLDSRNAALSVTRRGWPVVPGTSLGADRHLRQVDWAGMRLGMNWGQTGPLMPISDDL